MQRYRFDGGHDRNLLQRFPSEYHLGFPEYLVTVIQEPTFRAVIVALVRRCN